MCENGEDLPNENELEQMRLSMLSKICEIERLQEERMEQEYLKHPFSFPIRLRAEMIMFRADHFVEGLWDYGGWPRGEQFDSWEALERKNWDPAAEMKALRYSLKPVLIRLCIASCLRLREWVALRLASGKEQHWHEKQRKAPN